MYITRDDLIVLFGEQEINQLERNINKTTHDTIEHFIKNAVDDVNGYIAVRYPLPLPSVPERLKQSVAIITRYRLYKNRPTEQVRLDYEEELKWLNQVSNGKVVLIFDDNGKEAKQYSPMFTVQVGRF